MKHVGSAQHRERREITAEGPAADTNPPKVQVAEPLRGRVQRVDLVLKHRAREVTADRPVPLRAPPRGTPAVRDHYGETLVGEPLRGQVAAAGGEHLLAPWTAVGCEHDGQLGGTWPVP